MYKCAAAQCKVVEQWNYSNHALQRATVEQDAVGVRCVTDVTPILKYEQD